MSDLEIGNVSDDLRGELEERAAVEGVSLSDYLRRVIERNATALPTRGGRSSFTKISRTTPRHPRSSRPVTFLSSGALALSLFPCLQTARVRWNPPARRLLPLVRAKERPLIYYSWRAYEPLIFLAFRDVPSELKPTGIGQEGLLTRVLQRSTARFGYHVRTYPHYSPIQSTDDLIEVVKGGGSNIGLFPDAGGHHGRMRPGLAALARATKALLVPVVPRGHPSLMLPWPRRYGIPLPFSAIVVHNGDPLDGTKVTIGECQAALEEVEAAASPAGRGAQEAMSFWEHVLARPSKEVLRRRRANGQRSV